MDGINYLFRGFGFLTKKGVRLYVLIPLLVNLVLFALMLIWASHEFRHLIDWIDARLPDWLRWLNWLLWVFFSVTAFIFISYAFALFANLIAAPFNAFLSAKVQKLVTGEEPHDGLNFWTMVPSALKRQTKLILYYLMWAILTFTLFFIPVVNLLTTPAWFLLSAWMTAMQYLDYPMDNNGVKFTPMREKMAKSRLLCLNFGSVILVVTLIPIVNFLIMPAAVVAATLMYIEKFKS